MSVPLLLIRLLYDDLLRLPSPAATITLNRSTEPLRVSGSCTSSSRALSGFGSTVIAFICDLLFGEIRLDPSARRRDREDHVGFARNSILFLCFVHHTKLLRNRLPPTPPARAIPYAALPAVKAASLPPSS